MAGNRGPPRWNPYPNIEYYGPYPRKDLQKARGILITCLQNPRNANLKKVMPKCGISSEYGPAHPPPPPLPPPQPPQNYPPELHVLDDSPSSSTGVEHPRSTSRAWSPSLRHHSFEEEVQDDEHIASPHGHIPHYRSRKPLLPSPPKRPTHERDFQDNIDFTSDSPIAKGKQWQSNSSLVMGSANDIDYREYNSREITTKSPGEPSNFIKSNVESSNDKDYCKYVCDTDTLKAILQAAAKMPLLGKQGNENSLLPTPNIPGDSSGQLHNDHQSQNSSDFDNFNQDTGETMKSVGNELSGSLNMPAFFSNINTRHKPAEHHNQHIDNSSLSQNCHMDSLDSENTGNEITTGPENFFTLNAKGQQKSASLEDLNSSVAERQSANTSFSLPSCSYEDRNKIPFLSDSQSEEEEDRDKASQETDTESSRIEKVRSFSVWKTDNPYGESPSNLQVIFKCDTCCFASKESASIKKHLKDQAHYSASSYKAVLERQQVLLFSVQKMLVFINEAAVFKTQVVVCPECKDIFQDIFMCSVHYKQYHGSMNGLYSVCSVVSEEKYDFTRDECQHCLKKFDKLSSLKNHWQNEPRHRPSQKLNKDAFYLYFCSVCKTIVYDNLYAAMSHARVHEQKEKALKWNKWRNDNKCAVRQVHFSRVSHEMPVFDALQENALWKELEVVQKTKHFYNTFHTTAKDRRKRNLQLYRELRSKLGCDDYVVKEEEEEDRVEMTDYGDGLNGQDFDIHLVQHNAVSNTYNGFNKW